MKSLQWGSIVVCAAFVLIGCKQSTEPTLLVATASNTHYVMNELIQEFSDDQGVACELMVSSSGKLTAQIKEGAPYDVFISANLKYPMSLYQADLCSRPMVFAYGKLVLWSLKKENQLTLDDLKNEKLSKLALANSKTAPFGMAAKEVLIKLKLYQRLEKKLVFGESIAQVNHFVNSASVDLGFTSKSTVCSEAVKGKGEWVEVPSHLHTPISQTAVVLRNNRKKEEHAVEFLAFLGSVKAKEILRKHGYVMEAHE